MKTRILSFLLHHANRDPNLFKSDFYPIKARLLNRYADAGPIDIQLLAGKECFGCNGRGEYLKYMRGYSWKETYKWVSCYKCAGSGWWRDPSYTVLQCWTWHGYHFHQPIGRKDGKPDAYIWQTGARKIEGYIHKSSTAYTTEALFWLFLLYNRPAFWSMWRLLINPMPKAVGLLVTLKRLIHYFKEEYKRRQQHLDFGQLPEEPVYVAMDYGNSDDVLVYTNESDDDFSF